MRRPTRRPLVPALLTLMTMACSNGGTSSAAPRADAAPAAAGAAPSPARPSGAATGVSGFVEGRDYTVLQRVRFMDASGFEQPAEAFSVLLPRGWSHEGGIVWKGLQDCRGEMVGAAWTAASPDGAIRFASRPVHAWASSSDPMQMRHMQMQQRHGGCEVGGVVDAAQYLRDVFVPRELGGAVVTRLEPNAAAIRELQGQVGAARAKLVPYAGGARIDLTADAVIARLRWPDSSEGIAFVSVTHIVTTMTNAFSGMPQRLTNSSAPERSVIRFPADRRAEAETALANLKSSLRTNPQWKAAIDGYFERLRQQADVLHHQRMQAIAIQTAANARAHAQRMADIAAVGAASTQRHQQRMADMDANLRAWETQQSSQDRMHTAFVQGIREVETWQGGDGRVELSSGYGQAWSRGDGTYILSNSPSFDPRSAFLEQNWEELKRAEP